MYEKCFNRLKVFDLFSGKPIKQYTYIANPQKCLLAYSIIDIRCSTGSNGTVIHSPNLLVQSKIIGRKIRKCKQASHFLPYKHRFSQPLE